MRNRGSLGLIILASGLVLLAACGSDNAPVFPRVPTATLTPVPTAPPTSTRTPTIVVPPTDTPTPGGATPTPSPTFNGQAVCGNGKVEAPEQCDCGSVCVAGDAANLGNGCMADADCGTAGDCRPVGAQPVGTGQPGSCASGSPCAANCTFESAQSAQFAPTTCSAGTVGEPCDPNAGNQCGLTCSVGGCPCDNGSFARVQLSVLPLFLPLKGSQTFRFGAMRSDEVIGPSAKVLFHAGDIPVALRAPTNRGTPQASDFSFQPISLAGVGTCVCLRVFEEPSFGPGIASQGVIGCGDNGAQEQLPDADQTTDHNRGVISEDECLALPGQGMTRSSGVEVGGTGTCSSTTSGTCSGPESGGVTWQVGEACNATTECNDPHPTICNFIQSPPTFSGTPTKGSGFVNTFTSISAIPNDGTCVMAPVLENGPDQLPCTDDDLRQGIPSINYSATGTAVGRVLNANPPMGSTTPTGNTIGVGSLTTCTTNADCTVKGERCFNEGDLSKLCNGAANCKCRFDCATTACIAEAVGQNYDCSLTDDPAQFLISGRNVAAFGSLHAAAGQDVVGTTHFVLETGQ